MARFTIVSQGTWSYAVRGTVTRDVAIAEARAAMIHKYRQISQFLALPVEQLAVRVVEGIHTERLVRELPPAPHAETKE